MRTTIAQLIEGLSTVSTKLFTPTEEAKSSSVPGLLEAIEQARREWLQAKQYFEHVSDSDLVDYAIYALEAAQKKYMYLLKQARESGIKAELNFEYSEIN